MRRDAIYLAVIAVLVVLLVYAAAKAVRASRVMADVEERFGLRETVRASVPRREPLRQARAAELLRPRSYDEYRREVDALLARAQALGDFGPASHLAEACGKALAGGKRLRAVILLEVARAASVRRLRLWREQADAGAGDEPAPADAGEIALFVEYLHAASLVIDDLPAFDDDATRRGRPALHAEVGPAVAQMAALSLVAAAFQNVCRQIDWLRENCPEVKNVDRIGTRICSQVAQALGAMGAGGGQLLEMMPEDWAAVFESGGNISEAIAVRKTSSLFELAASAGWLAAGGDAALLDQVTLAGREVGTAFQIADDIGDMEKDAVKAAQKGLPDTNYANVYGRDIAAADLDRHLRGARLLLGRLGLWTPLWENELYPLVWGMTAAAGPGSAPPPPAPSPPPARAPAPAPAPGQSPQSDACARLSPAHQCGSSTA